MVHNQNLASFTGDKFLSFWDKLNTKIEAVGDTLEAQQKNKSSGEITLGNILGAKALSYGGLIGGGLLLSGASKGIQKLGETIAKIFSKYFDKFGKFSPIVSALFIRSCPKIVEIPSCPPP